MRSAHTLEAALRDFGIPALDAMGQFLRVSYQDAFNYVSTEFPKEQWPRYLPQHRREIIERDIEQVANRWDLDVTQMIGGGASTFRLLRRNGTNVSVHYKRDEAKDLSPTKYREEAISRCGQNNPEIFQPNFLADAESETYVAFVHGISDRDLSQIGYFSAILLDPQHNEVANIDVFRFILANSETVLEVKPEAQPNIIKVKQ